MTYIRGPRGVSAWFGCRLVFPLLPRSLKSPTLRRGTQSQTSWSPWGNGSAAPPCIARRAFAYGAQPAIRGTHDMGWPGPPVCRLRECCATRPKRNTSSDSDSGSRSNTSRGADGRGQHRPAGPGPLRPVRLASHLEFWAHVASERKECCCTAGLYHRQHNQL